MVIVHECHAHTIFLFADPHRFRHVFELGVALVAKEPHAVAQTNGQIDLTVIIKIPRRTSKTAVHKGQAEFLRHIPESSLAQIVE
jgi:hypothetical protein